MAIEATPTATAAAVPGEQPTVAQAALPPDGGPPDSREHTKTMLAAVAGAVALTLMVLGSFALVSIAAGPAPYHDWLVPSARPGFYPSWLSGPLAAVTSSLTLSNHTEETFFTADVSILFGCYLLVVLVAARLRAAWALGAVVVLHIIFFLSPPLTLTDVFNYLNYGRMEVLHGLNPYTTIPALEPHSDATFLLSNWHGLLSPYGPLFTLITLAIVPLGVAGSFWALKAVLMLLSLGTVWLVWRCAGLLGRNQLRAALFVGLNPLVLVWGLGGDHNDFFMVFLLMLACYLLLSARRRRELSAPAAPFVGTRTSRLGRIYDGRHRVFGLIDGAPRPRPAGEPGPWRELGAGVAIAAAVGIKASAGILVPVLLLGAARRSRVAVGLLLGAAAAATGTVLAFGYNLPNIGQQSNLVISTGVPNLIGYALGLGGETTGLRTIFTLALVVGVLAAALWAARTRRWPTACGYVTLMLLLTLSWTLPWYVYWLLPFAALARGRTLRIAALVLSAYLFLTTMPYASHVESALHLNASTTTLGRSEEQFVRSLLF